MVRPPQNLKNKMLTTLYSEGTIPAAYDSADATTQVVRVAAGQPLVFYSKHTGANAVTIDLAFMPYDVYADEDTPYNPSAPTGSDTGWYTLGGFEGGAIADQEIVFNAGGNFVVNTMDRETVTDATAGAEAMWRGFVPQGAGWLRVRLKAAGQPTTFELKMSNDNRGYING